MADVELRPGDNLNIVWNSVQETPFGKREVQSSFSFPYEEILRRLQEKSRTVKLRKPTSHGAKFSRMVALSFHALKTGKWTTGASIERSLVVDRLYKKFLLLSKEELSMITVHARDLLKDLALSDKLEQNEKKCFEDILSTLASI